MQEECNLSLKVTTRHPVGSNSDRTLQLCKKFAEEWVQRKDILYMQNYVFLNESVFDINLRCTRG